MTGQPEWAGAFVEALHPASIFCALTLPCVRAGIRKVRGRDKAFVRDQATHDAFSGLALPGFVALAISPMIPDVMKLLEGHNLQLAGILGVIFTIAQVLGKDEH